jgi:hypothetical protein
MSGHAVSFSIRPGWRDGKRGVIGRQPAKIKDFAGFPVCRYCPLPANQAIVNHDFMPGCEDADLMMIPREV